MNRSGRGAFRRIDLRLTAGYVGVLAGIILVFGAVVVLGFWLQSKERQDGMLLDLARGAVGAESGIRPNDDSGDPSPMELEPEVALVSVAPDGSLTPEASSGETLSLPNLPAADEVAARRSSNAVTVSSSVGNVRVVSVPVLQNGEVVAVVQAGQESAAVTGPVGELAFVLLPIGAVALLLSAIGGLLVSRRAIRPVEEAFERQRAFVADASHELKTPLTIIRADAEVLSRGDISREDRELVEDVLEETDRMSDILSDLLLLARLDAGKIPVASVPFYLKASLEDAVSRFATRAEESGIKLELEVEGDPRATGDAARTRQITAALLDNALRFTPATGTVKVASRERGSEVVVAVSDTGPGVPEEHLPHIFERFYRAEEARSRQGGGSGLGLTIARDLATAQNGDLKAGGSEGGGAVFVLTLPSSRSDRDSPASRPSGPGRENLAPERAGEV